MNEEQKNIQVPNFEGEKMKMPENTDAQPETRQESSVVNGPLLILLALLLVAILGGMYYWFGTLTVNAPSTDQTIERPTAEENNEPESTTAETQAEVMQTVSTSDEINAIEADIEASNFDSLDAELGTIDAELEADLQ